VTRAKATITLDRGKAARAAALVGAPSVSEAVDIALDRLIRAEELRRDIAAYGATPPTAEELALGDLPVDFDLGDDQTEYEALYGQQP
jgi:hypothetical protein